MAKYCASLTATLILLHIICAARGTELEAACKKAPDPGFCTPLLQPYAAQLEADPAKTGLVAMNATLWRVDELREHMVHEAVQERTGPEELDTISHCLSNVGNGEGALEVAVELLSETGGGGQRDELLKMIDSATSELGVCVDSLKKHDAIQEVVREALRLTEEAVQACAVAQALLP